LKTILFQGASITDCGRDGDYLGDGYVGMVCKSLNALYPDLELQIYNRGISGDKVNDLHARWKKDCLDLKPDILTILVGMNDVAKDVEQKFGTLIDDFEKDYRNIIDSALKIGTKIILLGIFLLPLNKEQENWCYDLSLKIEIIQKLAYEYKIEYIPLNDLFIKLATTFPNNTFVTDGIHPTPAGHRIIAKNLLNLLLNMLEC